MSSVDAEFHSVTNCDLKATSGASSVGLYDLEGTPGYLEEH